MKYSIKTVYRGNLICNPVLDCDKTIKSSALNRDFTLHRFGKTEGSDNVFSNAKSGSLIKIKTSGLKIQSLCFL